MSMGGGIEEVGARLVLLDVEAFKAGFADATKYVRTFDRAVVHATESATKGAEAVGKYADAAKASADSIKGSSAVIADANKAQAAAAKDAAAVTVDSAAKQAAAVDAGQKAEEAALARSTLSQRRYAAMQAKTWKTTLKSAGEFSSKVLKVGGAIGAFTLYEGIKNWMNLQQQMSQSAIDAGVHLRQIPALTNAALKYSSAYGIAADGTNGLADALYRIASAYPGIHATNKELKASLKYAAQMGVLTGQTGNMDTIARMYGAIVSNGLALNRGGKALTYSPSGFKSINEWALAVTGHGDMMPGDLQAALGTGILPVAHTYGLTLNDVGAMMDVLTPAMNASSAATRLKTAIGSIASPSQKAVQAAELTGGNFSTMAGLLRTGGPYAFANYLAGLRSRALSGNSFIGGGIFGAASGKYSGVAGAADWLKAYGFTNPALVSLLQAKGARGLDHLSSGKLQALGFMPGVTGKQAAQLVVSDLIGEMFGGGRMGAAIMQLVLERGTLKNKETGNKRAETATAYEKALKIAMAQPMRQWDIFNNKLKNFSIVIGRDVTPAFDGFLHDMEHLGNWFGKNKWAMKDLGIVAGGLLGSAALFKMLQGGISLFHGVKAFLKVAMHPIISIKNALRGTGAGAIDGAAKALTGAAADLSEAAVKIAEANGITLPGLPGEGGKGGKLRSLMGKAAKFGSRSMVAMLGGELYNQTVAPMVTHYLGKKTGKLVNDVFRDAAIGGTIGSTFGPWGGVAGGVAGAVVGLVQAMGLKGLGPDLKAAASAMVRVAGILGHLFPHPPAAKQMWPSWLLNANKHAGNFLKDLITGRWGVTPGAHIPLSAIIANHKPGTPGNLTPFMLPGYGGALTPSSSSLYSVAGWRTVAADFHRSTASLRASAEQWKRASDEDRQTARQASAAAQRSEVAAETMLKAANTLLEVPPMLQSALSPLNVHTLSTAGLRAKAARH